MTEDEKKMLVLYGAALYIIVFTFIEFLQHNTEFLFYTFIMGALILLLMRNNEKLHLNVFSVMSLVLIGAMHILAGNLHVYGQRLYDVQLLTWLRMDNVVHLLASILLGIVMYKLIREYAPNITSRLALFVLVILAVSGIGAINEIGELITVIYFNAAAQVGNYLNNALDLVFNLIGAIIGFCIARLSIPHTA
ncbi:MAG: DUF2238 domain-containing protein [archaeon]